MIDFGVSHDINHINNNGSWISNKRVGKTNYMAPEVWAQKDYDCRKADVWTLGVMLFMLLIGCPPYSRPIIKRHNKDSKGDAALTFLINGKIDIILNHWNRSWMISDDAKDLLIHIFRLENQRITMDQVLSHPFVGLRLNCDGGLSINQCPHVLRTIDVLIQHNQGLLNEYDFGTVRLLNDFNHILKDHIGRDGNGAFNQIYDLLISKATNHALIDINASNIFREFMEREVMILMI